MSRQFVRTFLGGRLVQSITSVTLVNNTQLAQILTVPAGKIWKLLSVRAVNVDDVARVIVVQTFDVAGLTNCLERLAYLSTGASAALHWPANETDNKNAVSSVYHDVILKAGNTLQITWTAGGASTGGGPDADGQVVQYLEIDA